MADIINFNPNTGVKLNPGEIVLNNQTGQYIQQGTVLGTTVPAPKPPAAAPVAPTTITPPAQNSSAPVIPSFPQNPTPNIIPVSTNQPPVTPIPPTPPAPTTTQQVNTYAPAAGYTGPSIVDFLKAASQPADSASIANLAAQYGVVSSPTQYSGTAAQNTSLLNILKGFASGKVSNLGIPATVASNAGTVPTPSTPINLNNLGGDNSNATSIAGANLPVGSGDINSQIAGLLSMYGAQTAQDKTVTDLQTKVTDVMNSLGQEPADLQAAMDANGVGAAYDQVKELNLQAAQLQGQLANFDVETQTQSDNLATQSIPTGLIVGQQAQYAQQRNNAKMAIAAQLSGTLALSQAYQGNATLGMQLAQQSVDLKYAPIQNQLDVLKTQLGYASDAASKADTAQSNIISKLIDMKQNELTQQKDDANKSLALAITAAGNGAPTTLVNQMKNSDPVTAASIGSQYVGSKSGQVGAGGTTGSGTSTVTFTQTQLNKGAANAGISIADFGNLSPDSQNYYINSYSTFAAALKAVQKDPTTAQATIDELNASNLPDDVKKNLVAKLKQYLPKSSSNPGFLQQAGGVISNIWNGIKSFF